MSRSLKLQARNRRIIELRCMGLTIPQIKDKLIEEGYKLSERTVWSDLHSQQSQEFIEELIRKQLADITLCSDDYKTRLMYRADLLDKLMPNKKPDVKVDVHVNQQALVEENNELLKRYDFLFNARPSQKGTLPADNPEEQVDHAQASNNT